MKSHTDRKCLGKRVIQTTRSGNAPQWLVLRPSLVVTLEVALALAGRYGQVHLIKENGRIRQVRTLYSEIEADRRELRVAVP